MEHIRRKIQDLGYYRPRIIWLGRQSQTSPLWEECSYQAFEGRLDLKLHFKANRERSKNFETFDSDEGKYSYSKDSRPRGI